jgi:hypothetical protein
MSKYLVRGQLQIAKGTRKGDMLISPEYFLARKGGRYCPTPCNSKGHKHLINCRT